MRLRTFMAMWVWLLASGAGACAQTALKKSHIDIIFSRNLLQSANRDDATAALRVWLSLMGQRRGFDMDVTVEILDDVTEIRKRVQSKAADILALDPVEYLKMGDLPGMEPSFSTSRLVEGGAARYLTLVRADSGINKLEDLRGKSVIVNGRGNLSVGQVWLDAQLADNRLGRADRLFHSLETLAKPSAAILPVFFGKADAVVVQESSFEVTKEMNPQVGAKLRILATSPPLLESVICIGKQTNYREDVIQGLRELHLDAQGRQVLVVFGFARMVPVDKAALGQVREMWQKHLQLEGAAEGIKRVEERP